MTPDFQKSRESLRMTPERQRWWDSLPAEEKRVRRSIKGLQFGLGACKEAYSEIKFLPRKQEKIQQIKKCCKVAKQAIKALRKQIAQYPYRKDTHRVHCPNCWVSIVECYNEPPYCKMCGQKLRWK